jgi:hypothetical protein
MRVRLPRSDGERHSSKAGGFTQRRARFAGPEGLLLESRAPAKANAHVRSQQRRSLLQGRGGRYRRRQCPGREHQGRGAPHAAPRGAGRARRLRRAVRDSRALQGTGAGLRHRRCRHQAAPGDAARHPRQHRHRPGGDVRQRPRGRRRRTAVLPRLLRHRPAQRRRGDPGHPGHRHRLRAGRLRAGRRRDRRDAGHVRRARITISPASASAWWRRAGSSTAATWRRAMP